MIVEQCLLAAHGAERRIKRLAILEIGEHNGMTNWLPAGEQLLHVMRSVEQVELSFRRTYTDEREPALDDDDAGDLICNLEDDFARLLEPCSSLKRLELSWWLPKDWPKHDPTYGLPQLREMVENLVWPQLTNLILIGFGTTADDLTSLLLRHSTTLRFFQFMNIYLTVGDWDAVFNTLAGSLSQLKDVFLEGDLTAKTGRFYPFDGEFESYNTGGARELWATFLREGGSLPWKPKMLPHGMDPETADGWDYHFAAQRANDDASSDGDISDTDPIGFTVTSSRRDPDRHSGFTFWNPETGSDLDGGHIEGSLDPDEDLEDDDEDVDDRHSGFTFW